MVDKKDTPKEKKESESVAKELKEEVKAKQEVKSKEKPKPRVEEKKESTAAKEAKKESTATKETKKEASDGEDSYSLDCVYALKSGMTRFFLEDGKSFPVTVLDMDEGTVLTQVNEKGTKHSVQLGFRKKKQQRAKKTEIGHCKKAQTPGFYTLKEFSVSGKLENAKVGMQVNPAFLKEGAFVDVQGLSKGKGFQGVMKRWGFKGKFSSHGHSLVHRTGGSIGQNTSPARVIKGKKMPGQMGHKKAVIQNLRVLSFDKKLGTLLVHGAVPGGKNGVLRITRSKKKG